MIDIRDEINKHKNVENTEKREVVLRPFKLRDAFKMRKWGTYKDLRFDHYNFPYRSIIDVILWYHYKRGYSEKKPLYAAINEDNRLVGYCILKNRTAKIGGEGELGVSFDTEYLNFGYGTSAIKQFVKVCFEELGLDRIWLETAAFNVRALKSYKKVGFKICSFQEKLFEDQTYAKEIFELYDGFTMKNDKIYTYYYFMDITKDRYYETIKPTELSKK